jgi:hypothetical protein
LTKGYDAVAKDELEQMIDAAASLLSLPLDPSWKPAVRANLETNLKLARLVDEFPLPDDAEPAGIFRA